MKPVNSNIIYIPPALAETIGEIAHGPLTLIAAGSGYGKTTAVASYLERLPQEVECPWYTCFGEPPERAWEGVCRLVAYANQRIGEYLSKLELPTVDHLGYISSLMGEMTCERETFLVIDSFQLAAFPAPRRLLNALAMHPCDKLHIVVLSHPLPAEEGASAGNPRMHIIPQKTFCFSATDIGKLFTLNGATLSAEQIARLGAATEGWVAALKLHLAALLAGGSLSSDRSINELLEASFWQRLNERQQQLFVGVSLLDTFTEAQAARMLGRDVVQDELWPSVWSNAFVRRAGNEYTLHALLRSFLAEKLQAQPEAFQKKMYGRAGTACQLQGKNIEALLFFINAGDDVGALSVPLSSVELAELVRAKTEKLNLLLSRCRTEVLERRWSLLLGTAVKAGLNEKTSLARTALTRLEQLRTLAGGDEALQRSAAAALEMAASFRAYNDIAEMSRHHVAAVALLDDPRDFYLTNDSWTFCIPSVVYMFWRESGGLARSVALCREGIPRYAMLGGGKGLGGPEMMAAEAALLAGNIEESVTQGYLARTVAQRAGQDSIVFCAHTLLARAALLRGDAATFLQSVKDIEQLAFRGREFLCVTASEAALGFLYSLLDREDRLPSWMLAAESVRAALYPVSVPFALIVALRHLRKSAPEQLVGTAEAFVREAEEQHHLLSKLYFLLEQAAFYEERGARRQALNRLEIALSLALPDGVLLPFAEYGAELAGALADESLCCPEKEALQSIRALARRFALGAAAVRAAMDGASPLTQREREIALMAQKNASTKRIAESLGISPATVKNTLSKVYSKLGIAGKSELEGRQL